MEAQNRSIQLRILKPGLVISTRRWEDQYEHRAPACTFKTLLSIDERLHDRFIYALARAPNSTAYC